VFERFSDDARQVVVCAQDEARRLRHGWIGTDHLLLGILRGVGPAAEALRAGGLSLERAREVAEALVPQRPEGEPLGMIPFTPDAKRALEAAGHEAAFAGRSEVAPRDVLLGLLARRTGSAACVLVAARVDVDAVLAELPLAQGAGPGDYRLDPSPRPDQRPAARRRRRRSRGRPQALETELARFTSGARQAVALAEDEARRLGHDWLGTEHLLLGLLREREGLAARTLESLDVTIGEVRMRTIEIVGEQDGDAAGEAALTARAKRVLTVALREAATLGQEQIGTEHVLLGLARESEGVAATILSEFRVDADRIDAELSHLLGDAPEAVAAPELASLADSVIKVRLRQLIVMIGREHESALQQDAYERAAALKSVERDLTDVLRRIQRLFSP
jgi:ATP-dependent Clp protease ATP-binding subunit ClpA